MLGGPEVVRVVLNSSSRKASTESVYIRGKGGTRLAQMLVRYSMGRHHWSRTDGGARSLVGQLDYELNSTKTVK